MGVMAILVVEARFASAKAAKRVKRYLPRKGRLALVGDAPAADRDAYAVIETLDYGDVDVVDATTLRCTFDLGGGHDPDEDVADMLDKFRALETEEVLAVLISDENYRLVYVMQPDGHVAYLLQDKTRDEAFRDWDVTHEQVLALAREILAEPTTVVREKNRWAKPGKVACLVRVR